MNQLFNQLNPSPTRNLSFLSKIKAMKNPQAFLQNAIQQNPQMQALLKAYNGDAKQAFYALAKQKGVDPNEILNALK